MLIQSMPGLPIEPHEHPVDPSKKVRELVVFQQESSYISFFLKILNAKKDFFLQKKIRYIIFDNINNFQYFSTENHEDITKYVLSHPLQQKKNKGPRMNKVIITSNLGCRPPYPLSPSTEQRVGHADRANL